MTKLSRQIKDHMTPSPVTIDAHASIEEAEAMMGERNLRHLPVEKDGFLVGVLSDRDLATGRAPRTSRKVEEVMTPQPFVVSPEDDIEKVAEVMASNRLGSVIVKGHGGKVSGIFTTTDALTLLAKVFKT